MRKARVIMVAAGACGVIFAAGGVTAALASIPGSNGVIHGCYGTTGLLRVISGTSCRAGEKALSWNQTGPPGAKYQFYEAISPRDTYSPNAFSSTPNSYGQYVGEAVIQNTVYCAVGDTMVWAEVYINNFYQADKQIYPEAAANGFATKAVILNPTQDPTPGGGTYEAFARGLCMTSGTPPVGPGGQYQDPRDN